MSSNELIRPFFWQNYSKKLKTKLQNPKFIGAFSENDAKDKRMRLIIGSDGAIEEGSKIIFYLLVDETDGVISDVKFQAFGPTALIGAAEALCALMLRKNYDQISRITADLIDQSLQDKSSISAFPSECTIFLNQVISAIEQVPFACADIPFKSDYTDTPISFDLEKNIIENFKELPTETKRKIIEEIIDKEVRPFVELDAGGVTVESLHDLTVFISYAGTCTSCHSATGATLNAIQQILKAKVHPEITVSVIL